MIRRTPNFVHAFVVVCLLVAGADGADVLALDHENDKAVSASDIVIFTHGDTKFAHFSEDGKATGRAVDVLACAAEKAGVNHTFAFAPLSRAAGIVDTMEHAVWFPSGLSDDPERSARMIGPIGTVNFVWYQRKENARDPMSPGFKENTLVTAYKGSAFENRLRREGYRWTEGSADHNRLMSMVLSKQVDALLAVDFTFKLAAGMKRIVEERVKIMPYDGIPVYFQVSRYLAQENPALVDRLRSAVTACTAP